MRKKSSSTNLKSNMKSNMRSNSRSTYHMNNANSNGIPEGEPWYGDVSANEKADAQFTQSSPKKVSKADFYSYRDRVYKLIEELKGGKDYAELPGNPFAQFSHSVIKDSPVKNYATELAAFKKAINTYFPDIYSQLMTNAGNTRVKERLFNSKIDNASAEEILRDVSSVTIQSLYDKQAKGIPLTAFEKQILSAYESLQNELRTGAKKQIKSDLSDWFSENWILVVIIAIILIMALKGK